jgi:hypothetical protein
MTIPHHPRARRALVRVLAPLLLLLPLLPVAAAAADTAPPGASSAADPARTVTVMTRNLYLGASLDGIIDALATGTQTDVVLAATATWQTVQTSDPAARMGAIADEIVAAKPTAVGLQEVSTWSTLPLNPATLQPLGAPTVRYDFLSLLLDALAARGVTYREVAGATPTNFTSPFIPVLVGGVPSQAVKLVDRDVILVRDGVKATNGRHGNFETIRACPSPAARSTWTAAGARPTSARGWPPSASSTPTPRPGATRRSGSVRCRSCSTPRTRSPRRAAPCPRCTSATTTPTRPPAAAT